MGFNQALAEEAHRARGPCSSMGLFYIDLYGFNSVNDDLGHEVGDRLLRVVAERLLERVRPGDPVARLGVVLRSESCRRLP